MYCSLKLPPPPFLTITRLTSVSRCMSTFSTCHVDLAIGWHCSSLYSFNVATPEYLYGEDEWHEMQCLCLLVLVWLQIYDCLISYPGSWWVGKEDSLLSTVADALSYPEILGNQELSCYIRTTVTSWRILTATAYCISFGCSIPVLSIGANWQKFV